EYYEEAFSRNIGLLTEFEQKSLANARIAIPGMGGVGGVHLITMTRSGVGKFNISDFDIFEAANINRQYGAKVSDFGRLKLQVMKEQALLINPFLEINEFPEGINKSNVDLFLKDVDVVLDGLDFFNFDIRRLLFKKAREKGIYVITAAPLGFSSALLVFAPDKGMGFDEYFNITKGMKSEEQYLAFAMGLAPRPTHAKYMDFSKVDFKLKKGPSLNVSCQICSGIAGTEAIRIILKRGGIKPVPYYFQFDPYLMKLRKGKLFLGNKNPVQRLKTRIVKYLLEKNKKKFTCIMPELPEISSNSGIISGKIIEFLLKAGIQAPSGDNAQPWKFSILENSILIYLDKEADESFFNINQIASIISCGAVIENIKIAASTFGIKTNINYVSDKKSENLMAKLDFYFMEDNQKIKKHILFDSIWKRKTNRKFYDNYSVSSAILNDIKQSISSLSGTNIQFLTERGKLKHLARMVYKVDQIRTQNRSLHEHLNKMIRFSDQEALIKRDGFPLKNLEAGIAGELFLKATKSWQVMNALNKTGISKIAAFHSYKGILSSSGVALVTVDGFDQASFLTGGRALERTWLALIRQGFCVQPMTAITLFWLRWLIKGKNEFPGSQQRLLAGVWKDFQKMYPDIDFNSKGPVMLFRFGKSDDISCGTLRKDLKFFVSNV
ncbi:MAG: ThiF family adenylyltransferase, partial [Proteobacteria bacterium]|nr:ThiF family adenylyltransferase [Pseudomonadota bacterium]